MAPRQDRTDRNPPLAGDRRNDDPWRADITQSINLLQQQHQNMTTQISDVKSDVAEVRRNTEDIVNLMKGFTVLAGAAKGLTAIASAVAVGWAALHYFGRNPPPL